MPILAPLAALASAILTPAGLQALALFMEVIATLITT
jgi:hypothetical protein